MDASSGPGPRSEAKPEAAAQARPEAFQRVAQALRKQAHPHAPVWLESSARTSQEAADALGVQVGQIAKSVIFKRLSDERAVLVVASGDRRVDEAKLSAITGPLGRADAAFVKASTGFVIGGVAPLAHLNAPLTLLDQDLQRFSTLWAAAGHPNGVFELSPAQLQALTGADWADVAQTPSTSGPSTGPSAVPLPSRPPIPAGDQQMYRSGKGRP